ncbi:hypothetical protein ACFQY4_00420 [Catellatospora bangladeshensis]|uniref:PknH-like extracellular domain-containing protein n=1 Tax=Catellatospora bangladeshensis TaxID=310355 RepID=A0A8J3JLN6_9ACTN|nr:hypothetical protein [Catellatospora bangladeshensis]GIF81195.1 hypothetical protein Cba03nite_25440 [Catellatospora bangladeshensis]
MSEIEDAFAQVNAEAQRKRLPPAEQLRTRGDRRARRRAAVGTLALVAVGAAAAVGLLPLAARHHPDQIAAPTGSVTTSPAAPASAPPSASPSPAAPPTAGCPGGSYTVQIPTKALVNGNAPGMEDHALAYRCGRAPSGDAARALPRVCKSGSHVSDRSILGRRGVYAYLKPPQPDYVPSSYFHTVTRYTAPEAASAYLAELRAAVARCGDGYADGAARYAYSLVDDTGAGDESLMLTLKVTYDEPIEGAPQEALFSISVIRVGDHVSVVFDVGWEGSPTPPKDLDPVLTKAVEKLLAL